MRGLSKILPDFLINKVDRRGMKTSRIVKLNFCMWLGIHRNNEFTQSKLYQIVNQLHLNNELSYKVVYLHMVRDPLKV